MQEKEEAFTTNYDSSKVCNVNNLVKKKKPLPNANAVSGVVDSKENNSSFINQDHSSANKDDKNTQDDIIIEPAMIIK